jgi:thiol-disulfide isomerase/thioredoxin
LIGLVSSVYLPFAGRSVIHPPGSEPVPLPIEGRLPSFSGSTVWLKSEPLTPEGLRGRVVLVDFWTYTCINWIRTLPYVRAWDAKYRSQGLTVIGVHTPEFGFERDLDNVASAVQTMDIDYPIAVDSGYAIWRAFENHYWPALYIADGQGRIRFHHLGEGEYAMTEMVVQQLLVEGGARTVGPDLASLEADGFKLGADWNNLRSPETYLGSTRITGFASRDGPRFGEPYDYAPPLQLRLNRWAPAGVWTIKAHAMVSNKPGGRIFYRFHARDLHLVMGPATAEASIPFRVLLDGEPPRAAHGGDIDPEGNGILTQQRLYQLIRQPGLITDRLFEIEFDDAAVETYCFTFG